LIEVVWDDAASGAGWHEIQEVKFEPQIVVTVGFLIAENNKYIIIGHTYSEGAYVGDFQIPKGMIISRKVLKRAAKGNKHAAQINR
jgi:hypothetical protein